MGTVRYVGDVAVDGHEGFVVAVDAAGDDAPDGAAEGVRAACECGWRGPTVLHRDLHTRPLYDLETLHREWDIHLAPFIAAVARRQPTTFTVAISDVDGRWQFACTRCGWTLAARVNSEGDRMVMVVAVETHRDDHEGLELSAAELVAEHTGHQAWTGAPRVGRPGGDGPTSAECAPRAGEAPAQPGRAAISTT